MWPKFYIETKAKNMQKCWKAKQVISFHQVYPFFSEFFVRLLLQLLFKYSLTHMSYKYVSHDITHAFRFRSVYDYHKKKKEKSIVTCYIDYKYFDLAIGNWINIDCNMLINRHMNVNDKIDKDKWHSYFVDIIANHINWLLSGIIKRHLVHVIAIFVLIFIGNETDESSGFWHHFLVIETAIKLS